MYQSIVEFGYDLYTHKAVTYHEDRQEGTKGTYSESLPIHPGPEMRILSNLLDQPSVSQL
jgi:hypothetical protein